MYVFYALSFTFAMFTTPALKSLLLAFLRYELNGLGYHLSPVGLAVFNNPSTLVVVFIIVSLCVWGGQTLASVVDLFLGVPARMAGRCLVRWVPVLNRLARLQLARERRKLDDIEAWLDNPAASSTVVEAA